MADEFFVSKLFESPSIVFSTKGIDRWLLDHDKAIDIKTLYSNTSQKIQEIFASSFHDRVQTQAHANKYMIFDFMRLFKAYKDVVVVSDDMKEICYDGNVYSLDACPVITMTIKDLCDLSTESRQDAILAVKTFYTADGLKTEFKVVDLEEEPNYEELQSRYIEEALNDLKMSEVAAYGDMLK